MTVRLVLGAVATVAVLGVDRLGHEAAVHPASAAGSLRAVVAVLVAGVLVLALTAHRQARR